MLKPISCSNCKARIGWYDTAFYNITRPVMPEGITVIVAFLLCRCGRRTKFDGRGQKNRDIKARTKGQDELCHS